MIFIYANDSFKGVKAKRIQLKVKDIGREYEQNSSRNMMGRDEF